MTLILALLCSDGLVMASDSQATIETTGQQLKGPAEKLFRPWDHIAWGASGATGIIQRVDIHLREKHAASAAFERMHPDEVRKRLAAEIAEVIHPLVTKQYLNLPGRSMPIAGFLFAGHTARGPVLFEVSDNLMDASHIETGYAAIGSGDIFPYYALAALSHFDVRNRTLEEAKAIAYRVVSDAINIAAFGLGPPVQMVEVRRQANGTYKVRKLSPEDLRILEDTVYTWKTLEVETLSASIGVAPPVTPPTQ